MSAKLKQLEDLLRPVVEALEYDFWGLEYLAQGRHSTLRIFIDHADGIAVEDCAKVSHQISGVLDVEDPIQNEYNLEVSSPGTDRPLFRLEHYKKFIGHQVAVRLQSPFEGRRKYQGIIKGVEGDDVLVVVDDHEFVLPFESIERAHIVPVYQ